jgi:hypothetical protein
MAGYVGFVADRIELIRKQITELDNPWRTIARDIPGAAVKVLKR